MKYVKTLTLAFTLTLVLATPAFAGGTGTPPEPPSCLPGEVQSPPCAEQSINDLTVVPGETSGPPAQPVFTVTDIAETVLWSLLLF